MCHKMANVLYKKYSIVVNKTLMLLIVLPTQNNILVKTLPVYVNHDIRIEEYNILCAILRQIQHLALPCAVFVT